VLLLLSIAEQKHSISFALFLNRLTYVSAIIIVACNKHMASQIMSSIHFVMNSSMEKGLLL